MRIPYLRILLPANCVPVNHTVNVWKLLAQCKRGSMQVAQMLRELQIGVMGTHRASAIHTAEKSLHG